MDSPLRSTPKRIVIAIVGPTAVGKSAVALELARKIDCEIISSDSMQVYREIEVMTSKPKREERNGVPHHLIDSIGVNESYSAADFSRQGRVLIEEIHQRGKVPLVVGGSGLYLQALVDGIFPAAGANWKIRRRLYREAEEEGTDALYKRLEEVDAAAAAKISPPDLRRIVRALEVFEVSGVPISKLKERTEGISELYDVKIFGLARERSELYTRINARADEMFDQGLVDEVKKLSALSMSRTASQVLGYKEVTGFLNDRYDLAEANRLLKRNTRHFAKRQLCWFKRDQRINWIEVGKAQSAAEIAAILEREIAN